MDRKEIKELAKNKIKGNKWNIIWPMLVIGLIEGVLENILGVSNYTQIDISNPEAMASYQMPTGTSIGLLVIGIIFGIVMVGYKKYIVNFVRTGKFEFNDILDCVKEKWVNILVASILMYLVIFACSLLFVIPGIIMALAYSMVAYIIIDTDKTGVDAMKESRAMMKGYKWNYFVFGLSFIGWILLTPFTFGLLLIWLYPYMTVADVLYYEKLKEVTKR